MDDKAFERHYTVTELAKLWNIGVESVRRMVMNDDDVFRLSGPSGKTSYRVPESVARRLHTQMTAPRKRPQLVKTR